jgi:hypothetical protein
MKKLSYSECTELNVRKYWTLQELLHGRLFGKRLMNVTTWDGKSK